MQEFSGVDLSLERVLTARAAVTSLFIKGEGIEVGAGSRPFPVPDHAIVRYGDIRDADELKEYFNSLPTVGGEQRFDAQTMVGFEHGSLDFVLSGHVIEHLKDPIGSIVNTMAVVKRGGVLVLSVPDMRFTFDRTRPETTVEHAVKDFADGGLSTVKQAFEEHLRYCHPIMTGGQTYDDFEIERQATLSAARANEIDLHYHAWTMQGFFRLLQACREFTAINVEFAVPIENENIFVISRS